jgi:hypothetical protein
VLFPYLRPRLLSSLFGVDPGVELREAFRRTVLLSTAAGETGFVWYLTGLRGSRRVMRRGDV